MQVISPLGLIWLLKEEVSLDWGRGVAVPGVGDDFAGPASHRGDPRKPHLPVDMLAGTAEFRLEQVAEIVQAQGEIVLVRFHQSPLKRLIPPLPRTGVAARPAIAAAA